MSVFGLIFLYFGSAGLISCVHTTRKAYKRTDRKYDSLADEMFDGFLKGIVGATVLPTIIGMVCCTTLRHCIEKIDSKE
jgi:hypothetical protein